jgi:hypothetical protein
MQLCSLGGRSEIRCLDIDLSELGSMAVTAGMVIQLPDLEQLLSNSLQLVRDMKKKLLVQSMQNPRQLAGLIR